MAIVQTITFEKAGEILDIDTLISVIEESINYSEIGTEIDKYAENITYSMVNEADGTVTLTRTWANDADYAAYKTACSDLNAAHRADIESNGITVTAVEP